VKAVIFLGPSLPLDEARQVLDAVYLPPAQQTDLLTATVNHRPDVIGLIDGVFLHSLSVWHKEILYALDQGILVYGASSMGALRAAETAEFGTIGVGEVYRQYASGELLDDDEVALAHAAADQGYKKLSEPMVNIRATFAAAEAAGLVDGDQRRQLDAIAKEMYFAERAFPAILRAARSAGLPPAVADELSRFVKASYVDLKKQDALALLAAVRDLSAEELEARRQRPKSFVLARSSFFETLYNRDRRVEHDGVRLPLETISNYVALHDPGFDELNFDALNRAVVFEMADVLGIEVGDEEVEAEAARFRKRRGLTEEADLESWLELNHLDRGEFRHLIYQVARCRRMHRWFLLALWMDRSTKTVLDELRLRGSYPEWMARAAAQERLLGTEKAREDHSAAIRTPLEELLAEHREWTECRIDVDAASWAEEAGFHSDGNLKMELSRAKAARLALLELLAEAVLTGAVEEGAPAPVHQP